MEVDAYCFSTIASYCVDATGKDVTNTAAKDATGTAYTAATSPNNLVSVTATADNIYDTLNDALLYFDEHEVPAENQIIFISPKWYNTLRKANKEFSRIVQNGQNKEVKFTLDSYEGRDIVVVPPSRFRTLFKVNATGGYGFAKGSKEIGLIVCAKDAIMHVVKYNKVKILSGDVVLAGQGFDGYMLFARIYHDVFVPDNKRYAVYTVVNAGSTAIAADDGVAVDSSKTVGSLG